MRPVWTEDAWMGLWGEKKVVTLLPSQWVHYRPPISFLGVLLLKVHPCSLRNSSGEVPGLSSCGCRHDETPRLARSNNTPIEGSKRTNSVWSWGCFGWGLWGIYERSFQYMNCKRFHPCAFQMYERCWVLMTRILDESLIRQHLDLFVKALYRKKSGGVYDKYNLEHTHPDPLATR